MSIKKKGHPSHYVNHSRTLARSSAIHSTRLSGDDWAKGRATGDTVWFLWDGTHFLFALNKKCQKYCNLLREPRVAIALVDPTNPYSSLEIRGIVAKIEAHCFTRDLPR